MSDFAVLVDEMMYLRNPTETLNRVILNLTAEELQAKINGVNLVQRLILPQHPQSLFVQAFGREVLQSFQEDYYAIEGTLYGESFNTSYHVNGVL